MAVSSTIRQLQPELDDLLLEVRPDQGHWCDADYLWLTDRTSRLVELTDGYLEVLPMPTDEHQGLLGFLFECLLIWTRQRGGKVRVAPLRMQIRPGKFREPDLLLLKDPDDPRRENRFWKGADLVIEIVSPDHPERDLVEKRLDYAEARIPEYWIVDPRARSLHQLRLDGASYQERLFTDSLFQSKLLPGFELDLQALFDSESPTESG